jgi:hypothetical protein
MEIKMHPEMNNMHEYLDLQEDDVILYLGGRIDDDNLYPEGYAKYLHSKIKELKPTKIIAHTHWYLQKYYAAGILDENIKIDMVLAYYDHFLRGPRETINLEDYRDGDDHSKHLGVLRKITDNNPDMIYATYNVRGYRGSSYPRSITLKHQRDWFGESYDLNNIKYFSYNRQYCPNDLVEWDMDPIDPSSLSPVEEFRKKHSGQKINATDGFAVINGFLNVEFENLNIIGFSAFGFDEDSSYFTPYNDLMGVSFRGLKYFDIKTSEKQSVEAEILKIYTEQGKINNLENYDRLLHFLNKEETTIDL